MHSNSMERRVVTILLCCTLCCASKCPEARKPHQTDCTVYYECINLPEGGYVWVPVKCQGGLLFQPYLRLCVLPGDIWTCMKSPLENPTDAKQSTAPEKPEYRTLNPNPFNSHTFFPFNHFHPIAPSPLITLHERNDQNDDEEIKNGIISTKVTKNQKLKELKRLIIYQTPNLSPTPSINQLSNTSTNEFFIQLIHNYIFNKSVNKADRKNGNHATTTEKPVSFEDVSVGSIDEIAVDDGTNNVIAIRGNLGNREYVTIEKYKSLSANFKIEVIEVIPCTTGIRLPNITDCMRYYTCDPKKAEVHEFTCPQYTAFNSQINLCDPRKYKSCGSRVEGVHVEKVILIEDGGKKLDVDRPCEKTGKFEHKTSEKFYYLCYTDGNTDNIAFVRLSCPNDLIFCGKRKICASKRFCYD